MQQNRHHECPECAADPGRRRFLTTAGAAVAAVAGGALGLDRAAAAVPPLPRGTKVPVAETTVRRLFDSLTAEQRKVAALPFDHPDATKISANWQIIKPTIGELYTEEQQRMIHEILRGVTSEEGYDRFIRQMQDDNGGIEKYACAIFGQPGVGKFEWVMTGRHLTIRADGNNIADAAFGGPIVYGHQAPGNKAENLFYYQTQMANEVFQALDGQQRAKALLPMAPKEDQIQLKSADYAGLAVGEMSKDQKELVHKVMKALLAPYREADVKEAVDGVHAHGGGDKLHLSFYRNDDLGSDQEWDIWRIEGPTVVWHFRGAPHVHTWVNMRTRP